jgi:uncharacterized beta-barrel protein YwiB (DUF1934 family)
MKGKRMEPDMKASSKKNRGQPVRISMQSEQYEVCASLFDAVYGLSGDAESGTSQGEECQPGQTDSTVPELVPLSPQEELALGVMEDGNSPNHYFVKPADPAVLRHMGRGSESDRAGDTGAKDDAVQAMELITEGMLYREPEPAGEGETITIAYDESELTGMEGSHSTVVFRTSESGLVHLIRSGPVSTALTFLAHHRAICTYNTPYMVFQVAVHSLAVDNSLLTDGVLKLDYIIEIRGACAERCHMTFRLFPQSDSL